MKKNETKEEVEAALAADQKQYLEVSKLKRQLKLRIQSRVKSLEFLNTENVFVNPHIRMINRDIDLCIDFIREKTCVGSKDIIEYLNIKLEGEKKRWPENKPLDSNYFMGRVGARLKEHPLIRYTKNNRGNLWEIR